VHPDTHESSRLARLVLRPLLGFIVLAALVIAALQGVGRVTFGLLVHLEGTANHLLASRQIRLMGLEGGWRGFNPVLRVARVEVPAGYFEDLHIELDLMRTLHANQLVLHRARIADASLLLEHDASVGWRLAGMPTRPAFDPLPLLTSSDQLQFSGALAFARGRHPLVRLAVEYTGINRGRQGRHRLILTNAGDDCVAPCELRAEFSADRMAWPFAAADYAVQVSATRFVLGEALLGSMSAELEALEIDWQLREARAGGRLVLAGQALPDAQQGPLRVRLTAVAGGDPHWHWARVSRLELRRDSATWNVPPLSVALGEGLAYATLAPLPIDDAAGLLATVFPQHETLTRWLGGLAASGQLQGVEAFLRLATRETGYRAQVRGLDMEGYRGVPWVRDVDAQITGYTRLASGRPQLDEAHLLGVRLDSSRMAIGFPDQFHARWPLTHARGGLQLWFRRHELGVRGTGLAARTDETTTSGGFGVSRIGAEEPDQRLSLLLDVDTIGSDAAREFVPYTLQSGLRNWLTTTPLNATIDAGRLAFQGQFRTAPDQLGRRLEIAGEVRDAAIRVHPEWPEVSEFTGRLEVAGSEVRVAARAASSLGADLAGTRLRLRNNGALAEVDLVAALDAGAALQLVRETPLAGWLTFVAADWTAAGPLAVRGDLNLPLRALNRQQPTGADTPPVAPAGLVLELQADLQDVALELPGFRLGLAGLNGPLSYGWPDRLSSTGIDGTLFSAPVRISAGAERGRFLVTALGRARATDVWTVLGAGDPGVATGATAFSALLEVPAPAGNAGERRRDAAPRLTLASDLQGIGLRLPGEYAKYPEDTTPTEVEVQFSDPERRLSFSYRNARGWLRFGDRLEQGAIGFGVEPPAPAAERAALFLGGRIVHLAADQLLPAAGGALPLPIRIENLYVDHLTVGGFETRGAFIEADLQADGFELRIISDNVTGSARRWMDRTAPGAAVVADVVIEQLLLPPASSGRDPLGVEVIPRLPAMDVVVNRLVAGDEDYGRWEFELRPQGPDLWLHNLRAELRGVNLTASEGMVWWGSRNQTEFSGELTMDNLAEVLPRWGYAANIETESARLAGTFRWAGSPTAFSLLALEGEARAQANTGRLLDVESGGGAQRILSLLNFTTFAKRISLDFSDVIGRGLSFDRLRGRFTLDHGRLDLIEPLEVDGTGLRLRISGSIDLNDRQLDHEMIVTLPVSRSLPWYAAYVGLANPIAGLGVLVGERVLRRPLEQFSSAKYRVTGTMETPQVSLVSVFDVSTTPRGEEEEVEFELEPGFELELQRGTLPAASGSRTTGAVEQQ
jgi:uncharacterized protein YhdP